MKVYYTTAALAERLGISQSHCQRLILRGDIPRPHAILVGDSAASRPPQHAYSEEQLILIKASYRRLRRRKKDRS